MDLSRENSKELTEILIDQASGEEISMIEKEAENSDKQGDDDSEHSRTSLLSTDANEFEKQIIDPETKLWYKRVQKWTDANKSAYLVIKSV